MQIERNLIHGQAQRLEKLLQKHISGVRGLAVCGDSNHKCLVIPGSSMVVNDFDFIRLAADPDKAHPVLIVDPNAILAAIP